MTPAQAIASDDYADFPAIAAAFDAIDNASNPSELTAAREALRKAELQRDIAIGCTDLWSDWEHDQAVKLGLIGSTES